LIDVLALGFFLVPDAESNSRIY